MPPFGPPWLIALTLIVMLVGLAGVFLPIVPDVALIWLAGLGYGLLHGFTLLGAVVLALMALLAVTAWVGDWLLTGVGARATGASLMGIAVGLVLMLAGTLLISPLAGVAAGLLAMILVEYLHHRNWRKALASATGAAAGCGLAYGLKFALAVLMIAAWGVWVWMG